MQIAMIDPSLFTWPYDAELALALRRAGHEVTIYGSESRLPDPPGAAGRLFRNHFYRDFHRQPWLWVPHATALAAKGINHIISMRRLVRELARTRPDTIHFQWTPLPVIDRLFLPELQAIAPLVLTIHDSTPFNGTPRSPVQNWGSRTIAGGFDRIIVHTRTAVERVVAQGVDRRRINVVPHGPLNLPSTSPVEAGNVPGSKVRLLCFGKIKHYKGLDLLVQALALLPEPARHLWQLRIVGEPHMDVSPLIELARQCGVDDRIEFDFRFVAEAEIPDLFAAADLLVMPYRQIDASGVLMSSLTAGLPIVASRLGLFAELLVDGQHGRLVPPEDIGELSAALAGLITNPASLPYMGLQVRRLVADIPGWDEIARRTSDVYAGARDSALEGAADGELQGGTE